MDFLLIKSIDMQAIERPFLNAIKSTMEENGSKYTIKHEVLYKKMIRYILMLITTGFGAEMQATVSARISQ